MGNHSRKKLRRDLWPAQNGWCTDTYVRTCSQESAGTLSLWLDMCVNMWQRGECQYRQEHLSCQQRLPITESEIEREKQNSWHYYAIVKTEVLAGGLPAAVSVLQENPNHPHTLLEERVTTSLTPGVCVCGGGGGWTVWQSSRGLWDTPPKQFLDIVRNGKEKKFNLNQKWVWESFDVPQRTFLFSSFSEIKIAQILWYTIVQNTDLKKRSCDL